MKTLEITNFGGPLTRLNTGDLNSGKARFATSWGYDPFSNPTNLTWFEQPTSILSDANATQIGAKTRFENGTSQYVYMVDTQRVLRKINPNQPGNPDRNLSSVISTLSVGSALGMDYGASMEFFGSTEKIYIGGSNGVVSVNFDGSSQAQVGVQANYTSDTYRPLKKFIGKLYFGNDNNIGAIDSTGLVVSSIVGSHYEELAPGLPAGIHISDLDATLDGNYLLMSAADIPPEAFNEERPLAAAASGQTYFYNGLDTAATASNALPSQPVKSLTVYPPGTILFANDAFGCSVSNGQQKLLMLPNNRAPRPNAVAVNGNFMTWVAPEYDGANIQASMYYYGQLDVENPSGLWRVLRTPSSLSNGQVRSTPLNIIVTNDFTGVGADLIPRVYGYGKHYFSTEEINDAAATKSTLQQFNVTPKGTGSVVAGVYETQSQLFSKKVGVGEVRFYTAPLVADNSFSLNIVDTESSIISSKTYTVGASSVAAGTNVVRWKPEIAPRYDLGFRICNLGTKNWTGYKLEADVEDAGT